MEKLTQGDGFAEGHLNAIIVINTTLSGGVLAGIPTSCERSFILVLVGLFARPKKGA